MTYIVTGLAYLLIIIVCWFVVMGCCKCPDPPSKITTDPITMFGKITGVKSEPWYGEKYDTMHTYYIETKEGHKFFALTHIYYRDNSVVSFYCGADRINLKRVIIIKEYDENCKY